MGAIEIVTMNEGMNEKIVTLKKDRKLKLNADLLQSASLIITII